VFVEQLDELGEVGQRPCQPVDLIDHDHVDLSSANVHNEDLGSSFTFTLVSGAIPEPSTWAMILLGFAGIGFAGYRKAKQAAVARA
jgi:hypothetical protein